MILERGLHLRSATLTLTLWLHEMGNVMSGFMALVMFVTLIVIIVRGFSKFQAKQSQLTRTASRRVTRPQPRIASPSPHAKAPTQAGQPSVLIIDDDAHTTVRLSAMFRQRGIGVVVENRGGIAGLEVLRRHRPSLIVLAVELPDTLGYEVCKKIKTNPSISEIPIFLISSTATREIFDNHARLKTHADEYIFKPIDAADLVAKAAFYIETSLSPQPKAKPQMAAPIQKAVTARQPSPPSSPSSDGPVVSSKDDGEQVQFEEIETQMDLADLANRLANATFTEAQSIEDSLEGQVFDVDLVVQRVERTSILESSGALAGGRTATGTTKIGDVPLIVRFPAADNYRIGAISRGDTLSVRAVFHDYENLFDRFVLNADT